MSDFLVFEHPDLLDAAGAPARTAQPAETAEHYAARGWVVVGRCPDPRIPETADEAVDREATATAAVATPASSAPAPTDPDEVADLDEDSTDPDD